MRVESRLPDASPNKSTALICAGLARTPGKTKISGRSQETVEIHVIVDVLIGCTGLRVRQILGQCLVGLIKSKADMDRVPRINGDPSCRVIRK